MGGLNQRSLRSFTNQSGKDNNLGPPPTKRGRRRHKYTKYTNNYRICDVCGYDRSYSHPGGYECSGYKIYAGCDMGEGPACTRFIRHQPTINLRNTMAITWAQHSKNMAELEPYVELLQDADEMETMVKWLSDCLHPDYVSEKFQQAYFMEIKDTLKWFKEHVEIAEERPRIVKQTVPGRKYLKYEHD